MKVTVRLDNNYEDGYSESETQHLQVDTPDTTTLDDWADDALFPLTGCGHSGNACYTATILACDEMPDLVGREWEWIG